MAKLKCSTYFLHIFLHIFLYIFSKFSSNFLQLFQMTKMKRFHHWSTNVCKNTVKVKAAFCSNEFLLCQKRVIFWLHGFCVNQPCTCCGNVLETSHIWHLVCVCVRINFSAICRLAPCLWDMGISKHKRRNATTRPVHLNSTGLLLQKQGVRRWNGAIFSCSTKASNSFTQNARQIETGRSGKREAEKVALQDPASTAAKTHRDCLRHCREVWCSSCSLLSNCHPAKRRVLTTQRARKTQCDFSGEFHPHWRARLLLEVDIHLGCFTWRHKRIDFLKSITLLPSPQAALFRIFWPHSQYPHKPWTHRTCCWQGNSAD